jgi:hypothetical protein
VTAGCFASSNLLGKLSVKVYFWSDLPLFWNANRPVALMARASDSKSEGWGFESLLACIEFLNGF